MISSISGMVKAVGDRFVIIDVHGVGLKIYMTGRALGRLSKPGSEVSVFSHLHVKEDALDLFGFTTEDELGFFEQLISISGVGPKSALAILDVGELKDLRAAIKENRPDLLTRAAGIGRKTAERIILELKSKVELAHADKTVARMDADSDLVETLVGLGYRREQVRNALGKLDPSVTSLEVRLKAALNILAGRSDRI